MKKMIAIVLALVCVIGLLGCNNTKQDEATTYDFIGEHEYFTISNGSITLSGGEQPFSGGEQNFNGGELTITQPSIFENVISYSTCFYTLRNGERDPFYSTTITGLTGNSAPIGEKLGYGSSTGSSMISNLEQGLWFELKTTDVHGTENVYQIELTLTE